MQSRIKSEFDAIVVGSGASGGWACKRLAEAGLKLALLEAGQPQSDQNFSEHKPEFELKYRNRAAEIVRKTRPVQSVFDVCNEYTQDWFANDLEEPYTTPKDQPFLWMGRLRLTGGRTNVWGRVSLRFSDWDLKAASHDGFGEDWPLNYKDLEPYYDLVEKYVGVTGMAEGLEHLPDGQFHPPMPLTCHETLVRNRVKEKLGRTVTLARSANITRPQNGRGACHYCGPCARGCVTHSYFNSAFTTVADAIKTGNCSLISNAMVHKILMDENTNRARGVLYVDRNTKQTREIYARVVILCAQTQESTRILFNSATKEHPNGIANTSGVLGHYLTAHVRSGGGDGELHRGGEAVRDQLDHRRLELVGVAELEPHRVADEARELQRDRVVEPEVLAQLRALLGRGLDPDHHVDRVADEAEQRERDQRHREHHHDGLQQAANDEGEHQV